MCLKKSPNPPASIVLSETIRDLFLLQVEQVPLNSLTGMPVFYFERYLHEYLW